MFLFPVSLYHCCYYYYFLAVFHIKQAVLAFNVSINNYIRHMAWHFFVVPYLFLLTNWASMFFLGFK